MLRLKVLGGTLVPCALLWSAFAPSPALAASASATPAAPVLRAASEPASFSPNGDGRKDVIAFTAAVSEAAVVDVRILERDGRVVRTIVEARPVAETLRIEWDGRRTDGTRARDGSYRIAVDAQDASGGVSSATAALRLDTTRPRLDLGSRPQIVGVSPLRAPFRVADASAPLALRGALVNAYGRVVRGWGPRRVRRGAGSAEVPRSFVRAVAPGVYRIRLAVEDAAGNRSSPRLSSAYRVDRAVRTRVVARVANTGRRVALTFDDCYVRPSWDSILRTLARARVTAAFFCPGSAVLAAPDLAARTARAGHIVGSHGWDHALLPETGYGGVLRRLTADRRVWWRWRSAATPYFRPPYGAYDAAALAAAGAAGYRYTVLWDVDTRDWTNPGIGAIVSRAVDRARPGSIILLHVKPQTAAALPHVIRRLRARRLAPVGLDELLHRSGAEPARAGWSPRMAAARLARPTR